MTLLKHLAEVRVSNVDKKTADGDTLVRLCNYTDVYYSEVLRADAGEYMSATATPEQRRAFALRSGDTVLTKDSETAEDIGISAYIEQSDDDFVCGYHLAIARPKATGVDPRFLRWSIASKFARGQLAAVATGVTRMGLRSEAIANLEIPDVPINDQRRIADYLDGECERLDRLIELRKGASALLAERNASMVTFMLFGSVDGSGVQDSGIPTIGHVPAHWRVVRNKNVFVEVANLSETGDEELLSVSHLTGVTPRSEKDVTMFMAESMIGYKRVYPGDLVINTMWAWMGALGVSAVEGIVSPAYGVYRLRSADAVPEFLDALYRTPAYVAEMTRYSKGVWSSRLRLYPESFLALRVPMPPRDEQERILLRVEAELAADRRMHKTLQRSIELLRERKQALITAAVTSKFDVTAASGRDV